MNLNFKGGVVWGNKLKKTVFELIILMFIIIYNVNCISSKTLQSTTDADECLNIKNFAFSFCLSYCYEETSKISRDARAVGSFYLQTGTSEQELYEKVDKLAKKYSKMHIATKDDIDFSLAKCLELYNSKELDSLIKKYCHRVIKGRTSVTYCMPIR